MPSPDTRPALAVALPFSLDEVRRQLALPDRYDYARAMQGPTGGASAELVWEGHLEPVVAHLDSVLTELRELGIEVALRITRSELRLLFQRAQLVTVVAHWKGARLLPGDLPDPVALARRILQEQSRVCDLLRSLIDRPALERVANAPDGPVGAHRVALARLLNGMIASETQLFGTSLPEHVQLMLLPLEREEFNRQQLDAWFEELIIPGNRIELQDGLLTETEFAELIPAHFVGTIHAANCHSVLLERCITTPTRRVLATQDVLPPLMVLELYLSVVRMLPNSDVPYEQLWLAVLDGLKGQEAALAETGRASWPKQIIARLIPRLFWRRTGNG
jgi:hypothetical protein